MKIRLEDMRWPEVEEALKGSHVVLLPTGATEQHGRHLPLSVDSRNATHLSELAARKVTDEHDIRVLVAPVIAYGEISGHGSYPGTIGVSPDTFSNMIEDIVRGFIGQGFKNILIINGHFGNVVPLSFALRKLNIDFPNVGLYAIRTASLSAKLVKDLRKSDVMAHACELETSLTLAIQPENVKLDEAVREVPDIPLSNKWWSIDKYGPKRMIYLPKKFPKMGKQAGVWGDPACSTREFGEKAIEAAVNDLSALLLEIVEAEDKVKEY